MPSNLHSARHPDWIMLMVVFNQNTGTSNKLSFYWSFNLNQRRSIKEKISDLELFKAKVYNNEVIPGRRLWDQFGSDEEEEDELD